MDKEIVKDAIRRYLNNELSESGRQQLIELFSNMTNDKAGELFDDLSSQVDDLSEAELRRLHRMLKYSALNRKFKKANPAPFKFKLSPTILKVAASIILVSVLSFFVGKLLLHRDNVSFEYVTKQNETGKKMKIVLPDGSDIWLNARSKVKFLKHFGLERRDVWLEGEAFFYVAPDRSRPFVIHTTQGLFTKVLGTSFNISAFERTGNVKIAVATGMVMVGKGTKVFGKLAKNQQLTYDASTKSFSIGKTEYADAWLRDELVFDRKTIREISNVLEHTYQVHIDISKDVPLDLKCTGTFSTDQSAEEIMKTLCRLYPITYEKENDTIRIRKESIMEK